MLTEVNKGSGMSPWTDKMDKLLKKLIEECHYTYKDAATELGVSRNAAIGRGRRLELFVPPTVIEKKKAEAKQAKIAEIKKRKEEAAAKTKAKAEAPPSPPHKPKPKRKRERLPPELRNDEIFSNWFDKPKEEKTILDIPQAFECKWVFGDVKSGKAKWCRELIAGKSYCAVHLKMAYQPDSVWKARRSRKEKE